MGAFLQHGPLSLILQYVFFAFLAGSMVFTTYYLYVSPDWREEGVALMRPRNLRPKHQAIFDVENIQYGSQMVQWEGNAEDRFPEDFLMSKIFASAMQPSKVIPYYFKAQRTFDKEEITITTLITENRYGVFRKLVRNYQGPISVTIHISDDDEKDAAFANLHEMYSSEELIKEFVDIHVVVDKFDFQLNMWRNVARFLARTDYFMMLDVDFHICTPLKAHLAENKLAMDLLRHGNALVLPAFEYKDEQDGVDSAAFPKDKQTLVQLAESKKIVSFHSVKFAAGHSATDYPKWYTATEVYEVEEFNWKYEPYIILRKDGIPWCDERFVGYGANKAACLYEIYISGVDYYVLPDDFLIHQSHSYPEEKRTGGRKLNGELYKGFRDELCYRYSRAMHYANELDTDKAHNLRQQCTKVRGFKDAFKEFPEMWN